MRAGVANGCFVAVHENVPMGRREGFNVSRECAEAGQGGVWVVGYQRIHETIECHIGGKRGPGAGGAGGGAVGVIVVSSLASAANWLDECCVMAASQRMNHKQCLCGASVARMHVQYTMCAFTHVNFQMSEGAKEP